jgi:hypothetical protein
MHALTFQQRPNVRRKPVAARRPRFPWKWATLTAVVAAGMTWTVSAARSAKMIAAPQEALPAPSAPHESAEALELKRLEIRNRRLEALVSVLRARAEEHSQK